MRIAIATIMQPFVYTETNIIADNLKKKMIEYGYEAQIIRFPFSSKPIDNIVDCIMAARLTKLVNIDLLIAMNFPTYLIPFENKKIWLANQFQQVYNHSLINDDFLVSNEYSQKTRKIILESDNLLFNSFREKIYTISQIVTDSLKRNNFIESTPLYPPLENDAIYYSEKGGNYIFCPGCVCESKRYGLLIEAMKYTKSNVRLILTSKYNTLHDENKIFHLIDKYNVSDKVTFLNRLNTEKERIDLYANCLGVAFIPVDIEYGYITLEAFKSSKPVITCTDSGCPASFVQHEQCGYIVNPIADELAGAMDKMYQMPKIASEMGQNAKLRLDEFDFNWDTIIKRLIR